MSQLMISIELKSESSNHIFSKKNSRKFSSVYHEIKDHLLHFQINELTQINRCIYVKRLFQHNGMLTIKTPKCCNILKNYWTKSTK